MNLTCVWIFTFIYMDLQDFSFSDHLLALAVFTSEFGVDAFTFSGALGTHRLDLLHHAWSKLMNPDLHASSSTSCALLNSSLLATTTCKSCINIVKEFLWSFSSHPHLNLTSKYYTHTIYTTLLILSLRNQDSNIASSLIVRSIFSLQYVIHYQVLEYK